MGRLKKTSRKPLRKSAGTGGLNLGSRAPIDSKISAEALHLEYLFEHGVNFRQRVITIWNDIDSEVFADIDAALTEMETQSKQAVTIRLFSFGGDPYAAMAIVGRMKRSTVSQIITEGYGAIMSAATLILAAGKKRRVSNYSWLLHHETSYELEYGSHTTHKEAVAQADAEEQYWAFWMSKFTNKTKKFWLEAGRKKNTYLDAKRLVEYGVVDELF